MLKVHSNIEIKRKLSKIIKIDLKDLENTITSYKNFIIKKNKKKVEWIIDRTCDHNFGKLILSNANNQTAKCPMHNWELDLKTLNYKNVNIKKKKLNFEINQNVLKIIDKEEYINFPKFLNDRANLNSSNIKLRYLSHASILIETDNFKMITDPWFFGPAFSNGWWLKKAPKFNLKNILNKIDFIYVSHNHPDHLHIETLNNLNKDINIIVPNFRDKSTETLIKRLGFKNIIVCDFNKIYEAKEKAVFFSILKSGDFREDSGIFINLCGKKILLNVDSNNLNFGILPKNIDILLSSYAGGASGFPLCFENYNEDEKERIIKRNLKAQFSMVLNLINKTNPKYFMPYAGSFSEYARRDNYILKNNKKNDISEIDNLFKKNLKKTKIIDYNLKDTLFYKKGSLEPQLLNLNTEKEIYKLNEEYISKYIAQSKDSVDKSNIDKIIKKYFIKSNFQDNLILLLVPTNDNFKTHRNYYLIDFTNIKTQFKIISKKEYKNFYENFNEKNKKLLILKVRTEAIINTINNKLPFEDLLIGFQCRVKRKPNVYNNKFWYHFTNKYIDGANFRYDNPCGSCEVLLQKIY